MRDHAVCCAVKSEAQNVHMTSLVGLALLLAMLAALLLPTRLLAASQDALTASEVQKMASHGQMVELLAALRQNSAGRGPYTQALVNSLERYVRNESRRQQVQQEAFDRAKQRMQNKLEQDELEDALGAAIEAQGLAPDEQAFMQSQSMHLLEGRAVDAAQRAEEMEDWVQALSYYRLLSLLHEDTNEYREDVERAARHVRVLQVYAPQQLRELIEKQRQRRGNALDDDTPMTEPTEWRELLSGIELSMLQQAMLKVAADHIESPGYAKMLKGGVDSMLTFMNTPGLEESFESLGNRKQADRFRTFLENLRDSLDQSSQYIDSRQAMAVVSRIMAMNQLTVGLPESVVVYELATGVTSTLDDFTAIIWPEDLEQFSRTTEGKFYGIGVQISRRDGRLVVISPLPNTPAQRAGLKAGDVISRVDGHDTATWSLDRAVREITGPEGEVVTLTIEREGETDPFNVPIARGEIEIESIRGWSHTPDGGWDYLLDDQSGVGYVRLSQFIPNSASDLDHAIASLQQHGELNGLILDLRFNPGGLLTSAVDIADRFVDQGPIVSTVDGRNTETSRHEAHRHATLPDIPVVVLVNEASASASEIVSGALQDYHRAIIIGERSFGKGSVQDLFPLARGQAYLKLTTQHYRLPDGRIIHRKPGSKVWGIDPDLEVPMSDRQTARMMEYRNEMDVIRDPDDAKTPAEVDEEVARILEDMKQEDPTRESFERLLRTGDVQDILNRGLDPQLEMALLIIQADLASEEMSRTAKADADNAQP